MSLSIPHPQLDQVLHFDSIDSTNTEARRNRWQWPRQNILLVADEQKAGRGRGNRSWTSPAGAGIWMTLLLSRPSILSRFTSLFSIYAAVILRQVLARHSKLTPKLKWPNDILIQGRKLAGILTETSWQGNTLQAIILGMGINLHPSPELAAGALQEKATSLDDWRDDRSDRERVLQDIVDHFFESLPLLDQPVELTGLWERNCSHMAARICIQDDGTEIEGKFLGINGEGQARIMTADGERLIAGTVF